MKQIITLDKTQIANEIQMGDGAFGHRYLAVAPDGSAHKIGWVEDNRQWNPWPNGWLTIGIPALDPDGSGEGSEAAQDFLQDIGKLDEAEALIETEDIGYIDAAERLDPEGWANHQTEATDWLAEAFLEACNGRGDDLNDPAPWGYEYDEYGQGPISEIEPPAEFEWAE